MPPFTHITHFQFAALILVLGARSVLHWRLFSIFFDLVFVHITGSCSACSVILCVFEYSGAAPVQKRVSDSAKDIVENLKTYAKK